MRLGLMGDIHGNSEALRAVLAGAEREGVGSLCVTGDSVGYYYHPAEVLTLLSGWKTYQVRGNHEDMLGQVRADVDKLPDFERRYGSGLRCALEELTHEQLESLRGLPASLRVTFGDCTVLLAHGTPWDVDQYVYPNAPSEVFERLAGLSVDVVALGHTHYRLQKTFGDRLIVNPGSVGQPRDRIRGAAWACFDSETRTCRQFIEPYDIGAVIEEVRMRDPQLPYLHQVLTRA